MKHSYSTVEAVRMVGHLLEHHGTTGPMARDPNGRTVDPDDSQASSFCMIGACIAVSRELDVDRTYITEAIRCYALEPGKYSLIRLWEGDIPRKHSTPEHRLEVARKLQAYGA